MTWSVTTGHNHYSHIILYMDISDICSHLFSICAVVNQVFYFSQTLYKLQMMWPLRYSASWSITRQFLRSWNIMPSRLVYSSAEQASVVIFVIK